MTSYSKTELFCNSIRLADNLKCVLKMNVTAVNPFGAADMLRYPCKACDRSACKNKSTCSASLKDITRLSCILGGRIIFLCPAGKLFAASPIIYENETIGLFTAEPAAQKAGSASFSAENIWRLSSFVRTAVGGLCTNSKRVLFSIPDCFEHMENCLLTSLRAGKISDFKSNTEQMLYDLMTKSSDFNAVKTYAFTVFILLLKICISEKLDVKSVFGQDYEMFLNLQSTKYETELEALLTNLAENLIHAAFGKLSSRQIAINEAISYIEEHYAEKLTLEKLSAEIFMSPHYLSKAFFSETGIKFIDFLNKVRVEKAVLLLENDNLSLKEIAEATGFGGQSYFTKVFKKVTGASPRQYKTALAKRYD